MRKKILKVTIMQNSGTEAIRTNLQPLKIKTGITKITNSQITKKHVVNDCAAISQKVTTQQQRTTTILMTWNGQE